MKYVVFFLLVTLVGCLFLGLLVGLFEKNKGWVKGHKPYGIYEKYLKRTLDFGSALFVLLLIWPLLLIVSLMIRIKLGTPIVFVQERPGISGDIFRIIKFRSMTDERDEDGNLLPDEKRLTRFGQILRSTSVDELLELLCIIKGDMSWIGPRPLAKQYLPYYSVEEMHRHDVRPGITGLSQVSGRNSVAWEDRFKLDIQYVNKITFKEDFSIFLKTIGTCLKRDNIGVRGLDGLEDFDKYRQKKMKQGM